MIYAAIAIMWAAVLIPMWLRNHDTATENRSAERFGQAMRVLSRKEQDDSDQMNEADDDQRPQHGMAPAAPVTPRSAPEPTLSQRRVPAPRPRPAQRPQRSLAQRRARTLGGLAGLLLVLALGAVTTTVPWWAPLPVAVLLVAFVVHLRLQARQQQRRRATTARRASGRDQAPAPVQRATSASSFVSGSSKALVVETKGARPDSEAGFDESADDSETWRPNPLPLPTYVTAPKAVRPIKVIDLTTPGAWTSGRFLEDELADEDLLAAAVADDELDALLEQEVAPPAEPKGHDQDKQRAVGD